MSLRELRQGIGHDSGEDGIVLVLTVLTISLLIGISGMAIDLGNWYLHIQQAKRASDAAALAGVAYLPQDPIAATNAAKANLALNNVPQADIDSATIKVVGGGGNDLYVGINTTAHNTFLPFLGVGRTNSFYRWSIATWQPGLGVGNYSNVLGNEPSDPSQPNNGQWMDPVKHAKEGQFWLALDGPNEAKENGDRFEAKYCDDGEYKCSGGNNSEYAQTPDGQRTKGYTFVVSADKGMPGASLDIQVYNPALAASEEDCTQAGSEELQAELPNDPRYQAGPTQWCTGDSWTGGMGFLGYGAGDEATMYYTVLDFATKQPVSTCQTAIFPPFPGNLAQYASDANFLREYHKWVDICAAPYNSATGSKYLVVAQVNTNTQGVHGFSLRAGLFTGGPGSVSSGSLLYTESQQSVRVYAQKDLPLWANFSGAQTQIAIAFIPPSYAGQTVTFEMFDLGDAEAAGTLSVYSDGTTASGAVPTSMCQYKPPKSNTFQSLPNCTLPGVQRDNGFNGQVFSIQWQVPADYTCDPSGANPALDCYLFQKLLYPAGTGVTDRTTWSASGTTQPIKLVNKP